MMKYEMKSMQDKYLEEREKALQEEKESREVINFWCSKAQFIERKRFSEAPITVWCKVVVRLSIYTVIHKLQTVRGLFVLR